MKQEILPYNLFSYQIDNLLQKDKVLFYYALKGRDGKSGILQDRSIVQMGRAVLLVPKTKEKEIRDFLALWKCKFVEKKVLIKKKYLF